LADFFAPLPRPLTGLLPSFFLFWKARILALSVGKPILEKKGGLRDSSGGSTGGSPKKRVPRFPEENPVTQPRGRPISGVGAGGEETTGEGGLAGGTNNPTPPGPPQRPRKWATPDLWAAQVR